VDARAAPTPDVQIWIDADACPRPIKEILYRAAERTRTPMILVANTPLQTPPSALIRTLRVRRGFDVADREIVEQVTAGDIVVTADIPLAADVVGRGAHALDPRGMLYTAENIPERLAVRNLMAELRSSGMQTGGPAAWGPSDTRPSRTSWTGPRRGRPGAGDGLESPVAR
jgi:uncharacterized protein YaiI (UPF0178 family)